MENTLQKTKLIIGGLVPFTTIDYPGKLSAVIFLQGCPWRCIYCSNPHLFEFKKYTEKDKQNYEYVINLLKKRKKVLDGIVFSGGEATFQTNAIIDTINEIKEFAPNFKFALHTNGCFPEKLKNLIPYIDWIGLDIKAPISKYDDITKIKKSGIPAYKSLDIIIDSGIKFEVRTTADPTILNKEDILEIVKYLSEKNVKHYAIQKYRPIDKNNKNNPTIEKIMQFFIDNNFKNKLKTMIPNIEYRE